MHPRRQILNILADGRFHSGEELGDALGISRMAVWKHIHSLREIGAAMEVVKGKGYRFPACMELLDADAIHAAALPETRRQLAGIETLLDIDSTSNRLRQQALEGALRADGQVGEYAFGGPAKKLALLRKERAL